MCHSIFLSSLSCSSFCMYILQFFACMLLSACRCMWRSPVASTTPCKQGIPADPSQAPIPDFCSQSSIHQWFWRAPMYHSSQCVQSCLRQKLLMGKKKQKGVSGWSIKVTLQCAVRVSFTYQNRHCGKVSFTKWIESNKTYSCHLQ